MQQLEESVKGVLAERFQFADFIKHDHQRGNGRVEVEGFNVFGHFGHGFVGHYFNFFRVAGRGQLDGVVPRHNTAQKTSYAFYAFHVPGFAGLKGAHEHFIHAESVRPVLGQNIVGVDDVFLGLGHFFHHGRKFFAGGFQEGLAVFKFYVLIAVISAHFVAVRESQNHALVAQFLERLFAVHHA